MIHITSRHYRALAEILLTAIHKADFYNGTIEMQDDEHSVSFRATLIIIRAPDYDPADPGLTTSSITDIIPVWWEHHLYGTTGERLTDFDWHDLKKNLI